MATNDSLGNRMKGYEGVSRTRLVPKTPVMIRLDGKAFHTYTRGLNRPWDDRFHLCMWDTARQLCDAVAGCQVAYVQSDEITLLLVDYASLKTQGYFDYEVQKLASVTAGIASSAFCMATAKHLPEKFEKSVSLGKGPSFDSRCWNLPQRDVVNCFLWRQQDCSRNSISMLAQAHFSPSRLHKVNSSGMQDLLMLEKGINWNDCPVPQKRGVCVTRQVYEKTVEGKTVVRSRWEVDENIPIFSTPEGRAYLDKFVYPALE